MLIFVVCPEMTQKPEWEAILSGICRETGDQATFIIQFQGGGANICGVQHLHTLLNKNEAPAGTVVLVGHEGCVQDGYTHLRRCSSRIKSGFEDSKAVWLYSQGEQFLWNWVQ